MAVLGLVRLCVAVLVCTSLLSEVNGGKSKSKKKTPADDELHSVGLAGLDVIGSRVIDEHHHVHDYPDIEDKSHESSSEGDNYHNPIYDHVHIDKDDYSEFGKLVKNHPKPIKIHKTKKSRKHKDSESSDSDEH